jgi:hypothetical protein
MGAPESSAFLGPLLGKHGGFLKSFLGGLVGLGGVFHRLPRVLVSGLVVFLAVMRGGDTMSVRGKFVQLRSSDVRILWHEFSPTAGLTLILRRMDVHDEGADGAEGIQERSFGQTAPSR